MKEVYKVITNEYNLFKSTLIVIAFQMINTNAKLYSQFLK